MTGPGPIDLSGELSKRATVHLNVGQEMVIITEDKLRLRLIEHRDCLADKKEWLTPLGILLALVATMVAADFHDFVFKAAVWTAAFGIGSVASFVWLCRAVWKAWSNRNLGSLDALIKRIKPDAVRPSFGPPLYAEFAKKLQEAFGGEGVITPTKEKKQ